MFSSYLQNVVQRKRPNLKKDGRVGENHITENVEPSTMDVANMRAVHQ